MKSSGKKKGNSINQRKDSSKDENFVDYYTPREVEALDKYQGFVNNKITDAELYDIITRNDYNDSKIKGELLERIRDLQQGDAYQWQVVDSIFYIFNRF